MMIESRSQICERNFNYEKSWWWWWWYVSATGLSYILRSKIRWWWCWCWWSSLVHRSVNGTSIMKQDDGDGDMFLSPICDIYFDRKIRWWWWWWSSLVHRSVNGTSIMKQDDGDGDMFLSQICDIYFDRNIRYDDDDRVSFTDLWTELQLRNNMWWWCVSVTDLWYILRSKNNDDATKP